VEDSVDVLVSVLDTGVGGGGRRLKLSTLNEPVCAPVREVISSTLLDGAIVLMLAVVDIIVVQLRPSGLYSVTTVVPS
jgi:hypothetical protein